MTLNLAYSTHKIDFHFWLKTTEETNFLKFIEKVIEKHRAKTGETHPKLKGNEVNPAVSCG